MMKSRRFLGFFFALAFCLPIIVQAQTKAIVYTTLAPSKTGFGGGGAVSSYYQSAQVPTIMTDGEVDSTWTSLKSTGFIGATPVWIATEVQAADTNGLKSGAYQQINTYYASSSLPEQYRVSQWTPVFFEAKNVDMTASGGKVTVGIPQGKFLITGVFVMGANDTAGYTSNATLAVGTNSTTFNNIVSSVSPSLGSPTSATATLVTPRIEVAAGTAIVVKNSTAAVATTEHASIIVTGINEN